MYVPTDLAGEISGLEKERRRWWLCNLHQVPVRWPQDLGERPPKPSVEELQATLRTFPMLAGTSFDAISPRQFLELDNAGLELLAEVISAMEEEATWPSLTTEICIIQKRLGGVRPIAVIMAIARIQARLRRGVARRWEALNDRPYWWAAKGRACDRAVWHQTAFAEWATTKGEECGDSS
eukprot:7154885-Pyramimonas_sp.AAC.1